jgi:hypothetical protein
VGFLIRSRRARWTFLIGIQVLLVGSLRWWPWAG